MLIRKNTKAFKSILEIVSACQGRDDRDKLIRLYITRAGHSIKDRIHVEAIQGDAALFYEMNYQSVLNNLQSSNHQLHVSDEIPGIYYFHPSSNKAWDETPFEFDEAIKKEFSSLPEFPLVRKKEKAEKYIFPSGKSDAPSAKKEKAAPAKAVKLKIEERGPKQPDYKLKHKIEFTDLEKDIFKQPKVTKKGVLDYYNNVSDYILPHLRHRTLTARRYSGNTKQLVEISLGGLFQDMEENVSNWISIVKIADGKAQKQLMLCNDREHLLFYVERGCVEFSPSFSKTRSIDSPDYMIIVIDSPEYEVAKAIDASLHAKEILDGLQLPSFIKTDGMSALHIYVPLDSKSNFEVSKAAAEYICKLIRLKTPDLVALKGFDENEYGKVSLDYSVNEDGKFIVAPYSLVQGESAIVATPLLWDEIKEGLRPEEFRHDAIFKRLKQIGDPFETLFKKKANADALLERLENNYAFLF